MRVSTRDSTVDISEKEYVSENKHGTYLLINEKKLVNNDFRQMHEGTVKQFSSTGTSL